MPLILTTVRQGLVLLALFIGLLPLALAQAPLRLDADHPVLDAWPQLTVHEEAGPALSWQQALAAAYQVPLTPQANLGRRSNAVWLRVPLQASDDGQWVLRIDFPGLDRVDGFLVADGRLVASARMGDHLPPGRRALDALSPAWALQLAPGVRHELLLRVQSATALVVPVQLMKPAAFGRSQDDRLLVYGFSTGLGLALVLYALTQWIGTRDPMFGWYGITCAGGTVFFLAFSGVGARHLWGELHPWTDQAAVVSALVSAAASAMLAERLLDLRRTRRTLSAGLRALSLLAAGGAVAVLAGVLPLTVGQTAASFLVPVPALLSLPVAWRRWRGGDRAALYLWVGWASVAGGLVPTVMLLRGWIDAGFWSLHAVQVGRLVGMLAWLRMLALRIAEARQRAERAEHAHRQLHVLAHADALTGLPNRRGLDQALQSALQRAAPARRVAIYVGDLDGFKPVNDRLGHEAGDELLVAAARRLRTRVRRGDVVARLGGDEFVIIAEDLVAEEDARLLGRVLVDAFAEPFALRGESVHVGLTLGFALTPGDGLEAADLLRRADEAMYAGKRAGKSRLVQCGPLAPG